MSVGSITFVAQAFALKGARSIIVLRSTPNKAGKVTSNIVWEYGQTTIPRHLRDIIITEYGIADLRGKSDRDTIVAMLSVTDSRFQAELLRKAKDAGKLEKNFELPKNVRDNTPEPNQPGAGAGSRKRAPSSVPARHGFYGNRATSFAGAWRAQHIVASLMLAQPRVAGFVVGANTCHAGMSFTHGIGHAENDGGPHICICAARRAGANPATVLSLGCGRISERSAPSQD